MRLSKAMKLAKGDDLAIRLPKSNGEGHVYFVVSKYRVPGGNVHRLMKFPQCTTMLGITLEFVRRKDFEIITLKEARDVIRRVR